MSFPFELVMGLSLALIALVAGASSVVVGLFAQIWSAAIQLRRFAQIFAGRPEAVEAYHRILAIYGWRARLAIRLFKIPPPPGISA